jgi:hypothetical protein
VKPHKGKLYSWKKVPIERREDWELLYGESLGLGYVITGFTTKTPKLGSMWRTSWVVSHRDNEIETRNSRYTLVGKGT